MFNPDIIIPSADKSNTTVVLDYSNYNFKLQDLLKEIAYSRLTKDLISRIHREITSQIETTSISVKSQLNLVP